MSLDTENNNIAGQNEQSAKRNDFAESGSKRQALGTLALSGLAALMASCGKFVSRYDKRLESTIRPKGTPDPTATPKDDDVVTATPTATATPKPVEPRPCLDVSMIPTVSPADVLKVQKPALYGSARSALLALKFKPGQLAAGDQVIVLALRPADEKQGVLLGAKRIQTADVYADGIGAILESLEFTGSTKLAVVFVRSGTASKFLIELAGAFRKSVPDSVGNLVQVYDLADAANAAQNGILFGLEYHVNAPMAASNSIGAAVDLGACPSAQRFLAAKEDSTWSHSRMTSPSGVAATDLRVEDIYGELINTSDTMLFKNHQSIAVYVKKTRTIAGVTVTGYLRYFFFVG